jgi:Skp family chaperone for outer membrane proteins
LLAWAGGIALVGAVGLTTLRSSAAGEHAYAPQAAPIVATIELQRLLNGTDELQARNKGMEERFKPLYDKGKELGSRLTALRKELDETPKDQVEKLRQIKLQGMELEGSLNALEKYLSESVNDEVGDSLREVHAKALVAIEQYAQQANIDLVLQDDSAMDVPANKGRDITNEAIIRRHVLYRKPALDITDDVLRMLNNQFKASGAKISKPAPPPAPKTAPAGKKK